MATNYLDNYYARLGVSINASQEEIRDAFHLAAKKLHPDKNAAPSANELFLQIQEAYQTLSDKSKRTLYDKKLPKDIISPPDILVNSIYSREKLPIGSSPQIIYLLLDLMANPKLEGKNKKIKPTLNLSLVLDTSTSMKGKRLDAVKNTASEIVNKLTDNDYFSIVSFNDQAEVLVPATRGNNISKVDSRIRIMNTKGGTEIYKGLLAGLQEISKNLNPALVNHLILITDGRTYGDESRCRELAEIALEKGITISCLGIGNDWNDIFLDDIAAKTGGSSFYASDSNQIQSILNKKLDHLNLTFANNIKLEYSTSDNIDLRYAFRISPDSNELEINNPLELGSIPIGKHLTILFEFFVPNINSDDKEIVLADGKLHLSIPNRTIPKTEFKINFSRPTAVNPKVSSPPRMLVRAMSKLSLYRMQENAQKEITNGNIIGATSILNNLEVKLLSSGHPDLAHTVHLEIEKINNGNSLSKEAQKQIKYGTRALVFPPENH